MKNILPYVVLIIVFIFLLVYAIFIIVRKASEYEVVEHYIASATVEYCDRHNLCRKVQVEEVFLVRNMRLNTITYYYEFVVDGELKRYKTDQVKVWFNEE